ncbi:MAG: MFS transporter [Candidatus Saganbacteria bacterium]|nr:MFS transporter [Candidatus Saganbacteria bacterium]
MEIEKRELELEIKPVGEIPGARFSQVLRDRDFLLLWSYTLVLSDILRGSMVLLIIPLVAKSLVLTFVVSFLIYTVSQFFAPAEASSIPEIVGKKNLIVANSLFMATWMISSILGIGLGAPLVTFFGESLTFTIAAAFYFISAAFIFFVRFRYTPVFKVPLWKTFWSDLIAGLEFIRRNIVVSFSLFKLFIATSALAIIAMLSLTYAKDILHIGERNFGYLIIAVGAGMFIGLAVLGLLSNYLKKGAIVVSSFLFSAIAILLLAKTSNVHFAIFLVVILGLGNILITSTLQTILQSNIPRSIRGRVFGVQNMVINSGFTFPLLIFGAMADYFGLRAAFAVLGAILLLTGIAGIFVPKFRTT